MRVGSAVRGAADLPSDDLGVGGGVKEYIPDDGMYRLASDPLGPSVQEGEVKKWARSHRDTAWWQMPSYGGLDRVAQPSQ